MDRGQLIAGSVFVFNPQEAGTKRWKDNLLWPPARQLGNFQIYREIEEPQTRHPEIMIKADGLVKKTITAGTLRLISYCTASDSALQAPNITRLEFTHSLLFTSDDLIAAIRNAPSLTHLQIDCCNKCFDDASIRSLFHKDGVALLAPHFHNLVVKTHIVNFTEEVLHHRDTIMPATDTELASYAVLPAVARWTYVELEFHSRFRRHYLGPHFTDMVKDIPSNILIYSKDIVE
ncbi:hypothetical protein B0H13DRAFT_2364032 [Mycena leptocephala]|nr:hypothetical protein B0H13DRAFT_2364032 [Mycena leptocephala]